MWRRRIPTAEEIQDRKIRKLSELLETIVLTLATLATVWAGYQAGEWNNVQNALNVRSTALRIEASQLSTQAEQLRQIDIILFTNWTNAYIADDPRLTAFYRDRFRDEFGPAFDAWLATDPFEDPDAPTSPFTMPQYYRIGRMDEAAARIEELEGLALSAERANSFGGQYTLSVVILAGALLLASIANRFEWAELRAVVIIAALLVLLFSVANIIRLPIV
jgi:hypothetical protein